LNNKSYKTPKNIFLIFLTQMTVEKRVGPQRNLCL